MTCTCWLLAGRLATTAILGMFLISSLLIAVSVRRGELRMAAILWLLLLILLESINQRTLDVFLAETMALLEQAKPKQVVFVQCDAEIHEWADDRRQRRPVWAQA